MDFLNIPKTKPLTADEKLAKKNELRQSFSTDERPLTDRFSDFRRRIAESMAGRNKAKAGEQ